MQVLLKPLTRQPLTEEEFYELGVATPGTRFAARLCRLLNRANHRKPRAVQRPEIEKVSQIPALEGCDSESHCMSPAHR